MRSSRNKVLESKIDDGKFIVFLPSSDSEIDYYSADLIKDMIKKAVQDGREKAYFDLANLVFIDSSGLGQLIAGTKKIKITLMNVNENIMKLILLTGVTDYFEYQ